jgi:hypothetical protein
LHQHRLLADPAVAIVDDARGPKNRDELVEGAMDVADSYDALGRLDVTRKVGSLWSAWLRCGSRSGNDQRQKRRKNNRANRTRRTRRREIGHTKDDIVYGRVSPVNHVMPGALAEILRRAPLTPEKIAFSWRSAVGPAVDKVTAIEFKDGVLFVRAKDAAWQREVERSAALIRSRLDALLGDRVVRHIEVAKL